MKIPKDYNEKIRDIYRFLDSLSHPPIDDIFSNIPKYLLKTPLIDIEIKQVTTNSSLKIHCPSKGLKAELTKDALSSFGLGVRNTYKSLADIKRKEQTKELQGAIEQVIQDFDKKLGDIYIPEILKILDNLFRELEKLNPKLSNEKICKYILTSINRKKIKLTQLKVLQYFLDYIQTINKLESQFPKSEAAKNLASSFEGSSIALFLFKDSSQEKITAIFEGLKNNISEFEQGNSKRLKEEVIKLCEDLKNKISVWRINFEQKNSSWLSKASEFWHNIWRRIKQNFFSKNIDQPARQQRIAKAEVGC